MRGGKTIRPGSGARNNCPRILAEDPDACLTSFAPALTSHRSSSETGGMLQAQVRGRTQGSCRSGGSTEHNHAPVWIKGSWDWVQTLPFILETDCLSPFPRVLLVKRLLITA